MKILLVISCFYLLFYSRIKSEITFTPPGPRDTAITIQNAYTHLCLDSLNVERFIQTEVELDTIAVKIRNFYNSRNYQFAWFYEEGLVPQGEAFWNEHNRYINIGDSTIYNQKLHHQMDELLFADTLSFLPRDSIALIELRLTQHFFKYVQFVYEGKLDPEEMQWHIPSRKFDAVMLMDFLFAKNSKFSEWQPLNPAFQRLHRVLFRYYLIQKNGGWPTLKTNESFKKGSIKEFISQLKKRMRITGDYLPSDNSFFFTDTLEKAVNKLKRSFGLKEDGIINAAFINELNVPINERIEQMLINLERMRWMPELPLKYIIANIPEYRFYVYENGQKVLGMNILVGRTVHKTVIFSGDLKYVVFSPYWNVPRNIVREEIIPDMKRDKNYLNKRNMEIIGYSDGLPLVRQKPGPKNSLGLVKFLFPNQYNIYFHDTPYKSLFSSQRKAFSHGCIRLQKPFELSKYLLNATEYWTDQDIKKAMNSGVEKWVSLKTPLPVFITYFTSWVDPDGLLNFRKDIYGHDMIMAKHLFH